MLDALNTHIASYKANQLTMTCYFLILYQILNQAQSKIIYEDLFNSVQDKWYAYRNSNCRNELDKSYFQSEQCKDYKILLINQCLSYEYHHLIFKTIELQPHYQLTLQLTFLREKPSVDPEFLVYIDDRIVHQKSYTNYINSNDFCTLNTRNYEFFPIIITIDHSSSSVTIAMIAQKGFWGITKFEISIIECSIGCDSCNNNRCFNQELFFNQFTSLDFSFVDIEKRWQTQDITNIQIDECLGFKYLVSNGDHLIKYFDLDYHHAISFQVKLLIFNSQSTYIHIFIDDVFVTSIKYIQVKFVMDLCKHISMQEINLFQYEHFNTKLKLEIKVQLIQDKNYKHTFIGIRDFQFFLINRSLDDRCFDNNIDPFDGCFSNNYDCIQGCGFCIKGICYGCMVGWEFNEQIGICIPYCGDAIITYNEECDDGNENVYDGCHECKYSCHNNCKKCEYGKCLECLIEYELDFHKNQCIPKCLDGIILYQEICDDENRIQFDGCYKCQKSCQIECLFCSNNQCYLCQEGWQLQQYQCIQICGDGQLAILSNEQCDDLENSYCTNCKYQCDPFCVICDKFNNCDICQSPLINIDGKCLPVCGDNVVTPLFEQCDDGNEIPYDGCYQCEYQCSYGCIKCEKDNHCVQCQNSQFFLDTQFFQCKTLQSQIEIKPEVDENIYIQCSQNQAFINNQCINLCGNGMFDRNFEYCDDGNNNGGDGCSSQCFEEDSYKCINQDNQLSYCTFIQHPNFIIMLLSDKQNQTKIIDLSFSQEVYLQSKLNFEQIVEFIIIPYTQFGLSVVPLNNLTSQLTNPHYQISIQFYSSVINPILQIKIQQDSILNQYDLDLNTNFKEIPLGTPFVLSKITQEKVIQVIKMNDAMVYSTVSIAGILFLTGNYIVFFNLLDLLQTLSYIRYMQQKFPPHLRQFLETYTKISLQPILDSLKVNEIIANLNGSTLPNQKIQSSQSISNNVLNQFYLINAKGCYLSYILSILTYIICCLISSNKVSTWLGIWYKKNEENLKILHFILKFQQKIQLKCLNIKNYYFSLGFFQLFYSTLHQQLFSTLLQFPIYNFDSPFKIINSIAALGNLIFLIHILLKLLSITTSKIKDKQKWKYFFQDTKSEFWATNYKPFQIYRTVFYISIITKFIRYPEAQSVLLSMSSLFYLIYLILYRPIKSNFEQAKLLCREIILSINTGSFLIYSLQLNDEQYLFYGWLHISLFCFLMGFTLIIDILEQGQKVYYIRLKQIQTQEKINIQRYSENPLQKFVEVNNLDIKK